MKILLVSNQLEGYANCHLAKRLQSDDHTPRLLETHWYHFIESDAVREFYADHDFDAFRSFQTEYESLYEVDEPTVDWEYLRWFEQERCVNKNLHQLLLTDPTLQRQQHPRRTYTTIESDQLLYHWAEKLLRWTEQQIESFDPDLIVTIGRNQFVKNAAAQVAMATGRPIRTLIESRIKDYVYFSSNFGLGQDPGAAEYIDDEQLTDDDLSDAVSYRRSFKESGEALYESQMMDWMEGTIVDPVEELKRVSKLHYRHIKRELTGQKSKYRGGIFARNHFAGDTRQLLWFKRYVVKNRLKYHYTDIFDRWFERSIPDRPFVYFPLHYRPESSVLTLTTDYYEEDILRHLSKEFPAGIEILAKENPLMIGPRPVSFYEDISDLPSVTLVDPSVPSKRLTAESRGVTTISGTALLEAALLNTPTLAFGTPEFVDVLDHQGRDEISAFVSRCLRDEGTDGLDRALRYVQYVLNHGRELDFGALRYRYPDPDAFKSAIDVVYEMLSEEMAGVSASPMASGSRDP